MRTHIDWITFTIPMIYTGQTNEAYADEIANGLEDMFGLELRAKFLGGIWEKQERSRAPYTDAWKLHEGGITLFASPNLTHACIEISGQGCERIIAESLMNEVLSKCKDRVTRIDIACDIETNTKPSDFVKELSHERMRTSGYVLSDTGETCYVGSKKSERYARVYRYNAPHPRSHLLRVEHVFRKDYAKRVAESASYASLDQISKSAGDAFGWSHVDWKPENVDAANISVTKERGNSGNTVFWMVHSVAPAFKRLVQTGAISDPKAFIEAYLMGGIDA